MRRALREARKRKNLTHEDVAKANGIARNYYTEIENGTAVPSLPVALRIALFLDVDPYVAFADVLVGKLKEKAS